MKFFIILKKRRKSLLDKQVTHKEHYMTLIFDPLVDCWLADTDNFDLFEISKQRRAKQTFKEMVRTRNFSVTWFLGCDKHYSNRPQQKCGNKSKKLSEVKKKMFSLRSVQEKRTLLRGRK